MRTALIIGYKHGDPSPVLLHHGNPTECNAHFKKTTVSPDLLCELQLSEMQLWESGAGITKRKRFEKQNNKNEAAASVQTDAAIPAGAAAAPAEPAPVEPPPASAPEPADAAEDEEPPLLPGQAKRRK
jgi:hypothetical protein